MRSRSLAASLSFGGPMSFSCPHFCPDEEHGLRLKTDCVPGRPGCVLGRETVFATPVAERIRLKEEERREQAARAGRVEAPVALPRRRAFPGASI